MYPLQKSRLLSPSSPDDYTSTTIQNALKEIGPLGTIYLPAGSTWRVEETIFLDDFQELATVGYPVGDGMAILEAEEGLQGHLLHAFDKSGIRIRNIVIEGNKVRIIQGLSHIDSDNLFRKNTDGKTKVL